MQKNLSCLFLAVSLVACVAEDDAPPTSEAGTSGAAPAVSTPQPIARPGAGPQLRELRWTWSGCGPTASLLPLALTVDVVVDSPNATYRIKGQAAGCDPFDASGELRVCTSYPAAPARSLTVEVSDGGYLDQSATTAVVDCVDGKITIPAPAN